MQGSQSESDVQLTPQEVVQTWLCEAVLEEGDVYAAKRAEARYAWNSSLEILIDGQALSVRATNISPNGMGLVSRHKLEAGQTVLLRREPSDPWIKARIVHVTQTVGGYKLGAQVDVVFELNDP